MGTPDLYYYLASLPTPGELGSTPPVTPAELITLLETAAGPRRLVETLFLMDDLTQREALLAGEIDQIEPVVLTIPQARNEAPLPTDLIFSRAETSEIPHGRVVAVDDLWETYFRHAARMADRYNNQFLAAWVGHEVAMRNALAADRAKRLGLDPTNYLVATDLADPDCDFSLLLAEWLAAPTPLEGYKTLIRARWAWIIEHQAWFSFSDDELTAYAAQVMLLQQWRRLTAPPAAPVTSAALAS
jgi:hypothetical protein